MRWKRQVTANALVAGHMKAFYRSLPQAAREVPTEVALAYAAHLFHRRRRELIDEKRFASSKFHVGIGIGTGGLNGLERLTKRSTLVSDALLLSHDRVGPGHRVRRISKRNRPQVIGYDPQDTYGPIDPGWIESVEDLYVHAPHLHNLGLWLLRAEPLLRAGLAWYLPTYSISSVSKTEGLSAPLVGLTYDRATEQVEFSNVPELLDFLQVGQRIVALDDTAPAVTAVVRPVIEDLELPFIDGVPLDVFSAVTVEEFESYRAFQLWLQQQLLSVDTALNAEDSERALMRIGLQIKEEVRGMEAQMRQVRRKRAVTATGAVVGSISASLTAVMGTSELVSAVAAFIGGATGGFWTAVQAGADHSPRTLQEGPWYYVWTLSRTERRS